MEKLGLYVYALLFSALLMACTSVSAAESPADDKTLVFAVPGTAPLETDTASLAVSREMYDHTLAEVKAFVDNLNMMIRNKNYSGWKNTLSDTLFTNISSPEFLAKASESQLLRSKKIVLKTSNDYFYNVVVPSRSNSRVDEIEFTAANTVKVYYMEKLEKKNDNNTITADTRRLRLYELVKSGDTWKIID